MSETKSPGSAPAAHGITRRGFLKTTGALAGAAAVAGGGQCLRTLTASDTAYAEGADKICNEVCFINCAAQNCGLKVHVRDGKIVKATRKTDVDIPDGVEGYEYDRRPCLRGRSHVQWIYHPDRIKYPMRRVEGTERGAGQWERISWDEAIEEIAEKFNSYRSEFGPQSIAMPYLTGNNGCVQGGYGVFSRFCNVAQATYLDYCLDWGWATGEKRVTGALFGVNNSFWDCTRSKNIFIWGANLTETLIQSWHWIPEAQEKGAKVICIDPRYTVTASKCDTFVPIKAGNDSALILSMMHHVIENNLCDTEYLAAHTVAPYLVREDTGAFLRMSDLGTPATEGPVNALTGKPTVVDPVVVWSRDEQKGVSEKDCANPELVGSFEVEGFKVTTAYSKLVSHTENYTLDWASELTGIAKDTIAQLAETFADGPTAVWTCYGFDRYDNSDMLGHALTTLCAITGNLGVTGGGFGLPGTAKGLMLFASTGWMMPNPKLRYTTVPWVCLPEILETGKHGGKDYPIKALLNISGNPFANHADQKHFLDEVLPKIEFVVTHDSRMTDTCRYSDMVLPAAHWWETDDIGASTWLQLNEKAIDPLYESKSNVDFLTLLAQSMGLGEYFTVTEKEACEQVVNTSTALQAAGITYEKLEKAGSLFNVSPQYYDGVAVRNFKFSSPSGKLEFYQEKPTPRIDYGQDFEKESRRLPTHSAPLEAYEGNPLKRTYPLVAFQEHTRWRVHTSYGELSWLRELDPEPVIKLNESDAAARGVQTGDKVKAFNDRGSVVAKAIVDASLPEGMCNIPKGWQRFQCEEGNYQELTSGQINPVSLNQSYNDILVEVSKM